DLIPTLGRLLDEPLGDGSIVPTHLLARFARQKVTVALGGDGGDELFAGYPTFQAERVAGLLMRAPRPVGRAATALFGVAAAALPVSLSYFSFDFKLKQFLRGSGLEGARRHQAWLGSLAPPDALAALAPDLAREVRGDLYELIDQRLQRVRSADRWDRLMYFYAKGYLADQVLAKVDRATMAVGLEGRAPLLDSRVVALACQVAPALRMRGLRGKLLLKHALAGILPAHTLARKKQGFAMPIGRWLKGELRPWLEDQLSEARLRDGGLLEPTFVRRLVDQHLRGQADHRKPLWTLLAFQQWWSAWRASA
ncbi:MAG TPA: asparagine synthase C-terminal domain-containing protein, partial [Polyangia bacterium]|nr:asparagine synthase C-terminal domain-containing protein [Polyangia bacterium]